MDDAMVVMLVFWLLTGHRRSRLAERGHKVQEERGALPALVIVAWLTARRTPQARTVDASKQELQDRQ